MLMFDIETKIRNLKHQTDSFFDFADQLYDLANGIYSEIADLEDMYSELIGEMICDEKEQVKTINENSCLKQEVEELKKELNLYNHHEV